MNSKLLNHLFVLLSLPFQLLNFIEKKNIYVLVSNFFSMKCIIKTIFE